MWRLAIFLAVCMLGIAALLMVFGQLRFHEGRHYRAEFTDVTGLAEGDFVRIAGVEVGKVDRITIESDSLVVVDFTADDAVVLTGATKAAVRWADLIGGRYLALEDGTGDTERLRPGQTIPASHTMPALDLDALIGGFRPLFKALDPDQVNALSGQLIAALQGQGTTVNAFLSQTAAVTTTLADRDQLIGQVIANLNTVLGTLGDQDEQLDKAVTALSQLVAGLAERKTDIANAVAYSNEAAGTVADLLTRARPSIQHVVSGTDRTSGVVLSDHAYFDDLLNTLPDTYQALSRQGIYGDFFSFYLCDIVLKLNGKGGQPVYVKIAGQSTGRCAPK
ncbi:MCE family protein [Mycolicibacterium sp.]|uniref:MCE family protein n=1 Tax=Mycolicibacterium sp. TaxID=2320850 RepID=UPI003D13A13B